MHSGQHTCEAFAFVGYQAFEQWARTKLGHRPAAYEALKEDLAWRMVRMLERRIPGLSRQIVFWSLGTPLTNEHYLHAPRGHLYGLEKSPDQVGPSAFPARTEFEGLFLCGSSTLSHGVAGVTASGMAAARAVLNCRTADLLSANGPPLQILPAEDTSVWPEYLRARIGNAPPASEVEEREFGIESTVQVPNPTSTR